MVVAFLSWLHDILIRLFGDLILAVALYKVLKHEWRSGIRPKRARRVGRRLKNAAGTQVVRISGQNRH
jgi:hypothetical protein